MDMFDWLDMALEVIRQHPETLFVIRAHPDELRVRKASRETVAAWVEASGAESMSPPAIANDRTRVIIS